MTKQSMVSILICTCNQARSLEQTLDSLRAAAVPPKVGCEVVVVDNASTDDTSDVVRSCRLPHTDVRYIHESRRGKGYAYNTGMSAATGSVFLWTDDDVRPPRDWITGMCQPIWDGVAHAVAGGVRIAPHLERPWMQPEHRICFADTAHLKPSVHAFDLVGANMAFSREVLSQVPAFDTELGPGALGFGDETLFSWQLKKAGYRLASSFDTVVEHHFDVSRLLRRTFLSIQDRSGRSHAYLAYHWKHQRNIVTLRRDLGWRFRLLAQRLQQGKREGKEEGIPVWELQARFDIAFRAQYLQEEQHPRKYDRFGLVKHTDV